MPPNYVAEWPNAIPPLGSADQRVYLYLIAAQAAIVLAIESAILAFSQSRIDLMSMQPLRTIICHFIFFSIIHIFQVALTLESIWKHDSVQMWWSVIMQIFLIPISSIQIFETRDAVRTALCSPHTSCTEFVAWWRVLRPLQITQTVVHSLVLPAQMISAIVLNQYLGWDWAYAADHILRGPIKIYRCFVLFSKFNFMLVTAIAAQLLVLAYHNGNVLQALSISALAIAFALFVCGIIAATLELRWLMYPTLALPMILQGYLIWRFGDFFRGETAHFYYNVRVSMSIQMIVAVWLLSETLYFAFHTTRSYGDAGLKDAKLGKPNHFLRRSWRVGQGRLDILKRPPGTEGSQYYYADGEEMKERASIV